MPADKVRKQFAFPVTMCSGNIKAVGFVPLDAFGENDGAGPTPLMCSGNIKAVGFVPLDSRASSRMTARGQPPLMCSGNIKAFVPLPSKE